MLRLSEPIAMLSDTAMKPEDPDEKTRAAVAASFLAATEEVSDRFDPYEASDCYYPHLDDPYDDPYMGDHEDDDLFSRDPVYQEIRHWGALNPSQGVVRILGRDEIKLGMTCDVEYGHARLAIEVEIVDIHTTDKRLVTVERTDGKKWEHHKTHTRIIRP